jgi:ATP phosphoribosyltransferase regulatory subunit HisZ
MKRRPLPAALIVAAAAVGGVPLALAPYAHAAPAPEVEYLYDVTVRRHYNFPNGTDALGYGHGICDKVTAGESYAQVMGDVKTDVTPNDEFAANYLVSYAVNLLCPAQIWQLRNSAAHYQPPVE